jgi:hypothetical protein
MIPATEAEKAPEFSRVDSRGVTISPADYRGKKNLLLVFNRGFG